MTIVDVKENYDYASELTNFIVRLIITIVLEFVIAFLFLYRKKYLAITILVNLITQIMLNLILNLGSYFSGKHHAMFLFISAELLVLFIEGIIYSIVLKKQGVKRAILYTIVANTITFFASFLIFWN